MVQDNKRILCFTLWHRYHIAKLKIRMRFVRKKQQHSNNDNNNEPNTIQDDNRSCTLKILSD